METKEMLPVLVRAATKDDTEFILQVEKECFAKHRQSTRKSISLSLNSATQLVLVAEIDAAIKGKKPVGVAIAFIYKKALRVYSIAVKKEHQRMGIGDLLMRSLIEHTQSLAFTKMTLEADASNTELITWYKKFGFETTELLEDYYAGGESAYKMIKIVQSLVKPSDRTIIIVDDPINLAEITDLSVYSAKDYLSNSALSKSNNYHVLNFCKTYRTHSIGYYVSLLASARNHRIIPSVMAFKDSKNHSISQSILDEIQYILPSLVKTVTECTIEITVIMGQAVDTNHARLGRKLFTLFNLPFFTIYIEKSKTWTVKRIHMLNIEEVVSTWPNILQSSLSNYITKKNFLRSRLKKYKYDLAILVNDKESNPPSCAKALSKFRDAAEDVGFFVEYITKADRNRISEFDALFIRETTALDDHTYSLARHAYTEGLVVIDDPWSILLCSNKVYLYERLSNAGILQPKGWSLIKNTLSKKDLQSFVYPLVLKLPESSFSKGVFKLENPSEMKEKLKEMFTKSDLVLAQEYMTSDYDWRIGVLDCKPLFACKYYMANGHWQIYNWQSEISENSSGRHETVPIEQVPSCVLKTAIKAAALIGNGLYGIDIKEVDKKAYVIEVNDNPNIDVGIEDAVLGDKLYETIMMTIFNRIEIERNQTRFLT
jgi:glutathione synthase/RimK-type ligase-like ATP-grasp enzyme/ribosomal protein S18 acetylase RimI-like enzyme